MARSMAGLICAAACLPAGFGVAVLTGVRPLGGLVLIALAWLAGRRGGMRWWYLVVALCFVASHILALATGAWIAVACVTAIATGAYVALLERLPRPSPGIETA